MQTAEEYYSSEDNFGGYQYINLKEVIDEMLQDTTYEDTYIQNVKRSKIRKEARNGVRELNRRIRKSVWAAEITVGPELYMALPQDYVDWIRVSVVNDDFRLKTIKKNQNIPMALGYLQDDNYNILFDNDGNILLADASNHFNKNYNLYRHVEDNESYYGQFNIDKRRGVIGFTSDLEDKSIVIEYISDGLQSEDLSDEAITIHKDLKDPLMAFIYYACIKWRRGVSQIEKRRAKLEYKSYLHEAKLDALEFNISGMGRTVEAQITNTSSIDY